MNDRSNQNMLILFLLILLVWYFLSPCRGGEESFDPTATEFMPIGAQRYDLRGYPIRRSNYNDVVHPANNNVILSNSCSDMYKSSSPPGAGFNQVPCPPINAYEGDTCWKSSRSESKAPLFAGKVNACPSARSILGGIEGPGCGM